MKRVLFSLLIAMALIALPAEAKTAAKNTGPRFLGTFGHWRTFAAPDHGKQVCYMALTQHGVDKFRHGDAVLTVTHRPAENSLDVFSYAPAYTYKPSSDMDLHIGSYSFNLFTSDNAAWSRDTATDHRIAALVQREKSISITGTPAKKGPKRLTDTFSLTGGADAYRAISKACGVSLPAMPKAKKAH